MDPVEGGWGSWASHEEEQLARWASLSHGERLAWLEQAKAFAALAREADRARHLASGPDLPDDTVAGPDARKLPPSG